MNAEPRARLRRRPARSALLALTLLWASGCATSGPAAREASAAAAPESGEVVLGRVCAPCHTSGKADRPALSAAELSSPIAARALRAVVAGEMPPRSAAALSDERRDTLVSFLCERAGHRASHCEALARRDPRPPIRTAPTFFQSLGRVTAREVPDQLRELSFLHTDPDAPRVVLTPSGAALVIAAATAVCAGDPASPGADPAELTRCIRRVLEVGIKPARPPADSRARPGGARR